MRLHSALTATILVVLAALPAQADPPECLPFAGTMQPLSRAGYADDVYVQHVGFAGDLLIAACQDAIDILDVADPGHPTLVHRIPRARTVQQIAVRDHLVYYTASTEFGIYDISDPQAPVLVHTTAGTANGIALLDDLLAVNRQGSVLLYSLANPTLPVLLASIPVNARPVFLDATRLALLSTGFSIYDLSDPAAPQPTHQLVLSYGEPGHTTSVANLALWNGTLVGRVVDDHYSGSMQMGDYRSRRDYSRRQWDISSPGEPVELQAVSTGVFETTTTINGPEYPLLRVGDLFIDQRDVFAPVTGSLATVSRIPLASPVRGGLTIGSDGEVIAVSRREIIAATADGLSVPNLATVPHVSNPDYLAAAASKDVSAILETTPADDMHWRYTYYYGFTPDSVDQPLYAEIESFYGAPRLRVIDRDIFWHFGVGVTHYRVSEGGAVRGNVAIGLVDEILDGPGYTIVVLGGGQLSLHDLTDPLAPVGLGSLDLTSSGIGAVNSASITGNLVLVSGDLGVVVVSIADLWAPEQLATLALDDVQWAVGTSPGEAIALASGQLHRLDLSDPANPTVAFSAPAGMVEAPLHVDGEYAYSLNDDVVILLDLTTLEIVGAIVLGELQGVLQVRSDGSLFVAGLHTPWTAIPAACEVSVVATPEVPSRDVSRLAIVPNPFNPQTTVTLDLATSGPARLEIFDPRGRRVRAFALGELPAGRYCVSWEGRDDAGRAVAAGVYLLRLTSPAGTAMARAALVR